MVTWPWVGGFVTGRAGRFRRRSGRGRARPISNGPGMSASSRGRGVSGGRWGREDKGRRRGLVLWAGMGLEGFLRGILGWGGGVRGEWVIAQRSGRGGVG